MKAGRLVLGVVELTKAVTKLAPRDVELKPLGDIGVGVTGAGQGRNFNWVFADKRGLPEFVFYRFFKVQNLQTREAAR